MQARIPAPLLLYPAPTILQLPLELELPLPLERRGLRASCCGA